MPAPNEGDQKPAGRALKLDPCNGRPGFHLNLFFAWEEDGSAEQKTCLLDFTMQVGLKAKIRIDTALYRETAVHPDIFHDEGEESAHWFGIASKHGTCAVGVSTTSRQYMVANGTCPGALPGTQNVTHT